MLGQLAPDLLVLKKGRRTRTMMQRRRVLLHVRRKLGDELFLQVATFVPMSCQLGLADAEEGGVGERLRQSVREHHQHHWLMPYIDRPLASVKVSVDSLSQAIAPSFESEPRLDREGVYALLALRFFDSMPEMSADSAETRMENIDSTNADFTSDKFLNTPLCFAIAADATDILRLLLQHRAEPNGYQSWWMSQPSWDDPLTKVTPLFLAVMMRRHNCVLVLLQGRADPDVWGCHRQWCGERHRVMWNEMRFEHATPLWQSVKHACSSSPTAQQGIVSRAILESLLFFGARPSIIGSRDRICPCDGFPMDSDRGAVLEGNALVDLSRMTPLAAASKSSTGSLGDEHRSWDPQYEHHRPWDPHFSVDVVHMLQTRGR